jgi:hypothetical protein
MFVSARIQGRLANNLFQYVAAKIMGKKLNLSYMYNSVPHSGIVLNDFIFKQFYDECDGKKLGQFDGLYLDGFFQFDYLIQEHIEFIKSLFVTSNSDRINDSLTVSEFVNFIENYKCDVIQNEDLVLHLRLDDYVDHHSLISPLSTVKLIRQLMIDHQFKRLVIVTDKIRQPFELKYLNVFSIFKPVILSGTMMEDFTRLYKAKNVILSNSTFAWMSMILSEKRTHWIPQNLGGFQAQVFHRVNDESIVYPVKQMSKEEFSI